jgi:hypothetical protein
VARLEELNVFSCCVDIFFDNPWNNFVHHQVCVFFVFPVPVFDILDQVYLLLSRVLSASSDGAIIERMLRSSRLPQKLIGKENFLCFCFFFPYLR